MTTLAEEDPVRAIRNAAERIRRIVGDDPGVAAELEIVERALRQIGVHARGLPRPPDDGSSPPQGAA